MKNRINILFACLIFVSATAFALEDPVLPIEGVTGEISAGRPAGQQDFHSSTNKEIEVSKCKTQVVPSTTDLGKEILASSSVVESAFHAFNIPQKKLSSSCKNSLCQILHVFGRDAGYRLVFLYRLGFNGTPFTEDENARPWKTNELNDVIAGVLDLPIQYFSFSNKQLTHFLDGMTYEIYGDDSHVAANASIEVFDNWNNSSSAEKQYSIFHEIAHNIDEKLNTEDKSNNLKSIWSSLTQTSVYGASNRAEDIAESISGYRYSPGYLQNVSSAKYAWIRDHIFKGLEFNSDSECSGQTNTAIEQLADQLSAELKDQQSLPALQYAPFALGSDRLAAARLACFGQFYSEDQNAFQLCFETQAKKIASENVKIVGTISFDNAWGAARVIQKQTNPSAVQPYFLINAMIARAATDHQTQIAEFKTKPDPRWIQVKEDLGRDLSALESEKSKNIAALLPWVKCAEGSMISDPASDLSYEKSGFQYHGLMIFDLVTATKGVSTFQDFKPIVIEFLTKKAMAGVGSGSPYCFDTRLYMAFERAPESVKSYYRKMVRDEVQRSLEDALLSSDQELHALYDVLKSQVSRLFENMAYMEHLKVSKNAAGEFDDKACTTLFPDAVSFCRQYLRPIAGKNAGDWVINKSVLKLDSIFAHE